jgi:hypothetical protein
MVLDLLLSPEGPRRPRRRWRPCAGTRCGRPRCRWPTFRGCRVPSSARPATRARPPGPRATSRCAEGRRRRASRRSACGPPGHMVVWWCLGRGGPRSQRAAGEECLTGMHLPTPPRRRAGVRGGARQGAGGGAAPRHARIGRARLRQGARAASALQRCCRCSMARCGAGGLRNAARQPLICGAPQAPSVRSYTHPPATSARPGAERCGGGAPRRSAAAGGARRRQRSGGAGGQRHSDAGAAAGDRRLAPACSGRGAPACSAGAQLVAPPLGTAARPHAALAAVASPSCYALPTPPPFPRSRCSGAQVAHVRQGQPGRHAGRAGAQRRARARRTPPRRGRGGRHGRDALQARRRRGLAVEGACAVASG